MVNLCQDFVLSMWSGHVEWFLKDILFKFNPLVQTKAQVALHLYCYSKYFIWFSKQQYFPISLHDNVNLLSTVMTCDILESEWSGLVIWTKRQSAGSSVLKGT